ISAKSSLAGSDHAEFQDPNVAPNLSHAGSAVYMLSFCPEWYFHHGVCCAKDWGPTKVWTPVIALDFHGHCPLEDGNPSMTLQHMFSPHPNIHLPQYGLSERLPAHLYQDPDSPTG
ncbi:mCG146295, partial [Mus musculus]